MLDTSSKKSIKRYKELLKVLEKSTSENEFKRYLRFYVEVRRATFKGRLSNTNLDRHIDLTLNVETTRMSILGGSSTQSYQRGSHPAIIQFSEISTCIEEELQVAVLIFDQGNIAGFSGLSIAVKVCEKLIGKLVEMLGQCEQELSSIISEDGSIKPFVVMMDVIETMQETMPKSFPQLIKIKDVPFKKAVESILVKSQQLIMLSHHYIQD